MESVQEQRDARIVRRIPALVLAFVMVASIGVVPVQAVATVIAGTSALNWSQLSNSFPDRMQPITDVAGLSHALGSFNINSNAPVEMVVSLPGVSHLEPVQTMEPALDNSVPFILGGQSYAALGADGTGTRIAIIDTGIDYTHADFGGSGDPKVYAAIDPTVLAPGTFPTAKVIGGTDLVGEWYDANCPPVPPKPKVCSSIPMPDPNPIDLNGHGTHVAGIAAGIGTSKVAHGVAPGAKLLIFKVFAEGSTSSANVAAAIEMATDPNG